MIIDHKLYFRVNPTSHQRHSSPSLPVVIRSCSQNHRGWVPSSLEDRARMSSKCPANAEQWEHGLRKKHGQCCFLQNRWTLVWNLIDPQGSCNGHVVGHVLLKHDDDDDDDDDDDGDDGDDELYNSGIWKKTMAGLFSDIPTWQDSKSSRLQAPPAIRPCLARPTKCNANDLQCIVLTCPQLVLHDP